MARPICLRLFWHWARAAAARTFWTAGRSRPIRTAIMAITTSSSINVNARQRACTNLPRDLNIRGSSRESEGETTRKKVAALDVGAAYLNKLDGCLKVV